MAGNLVPGSTNHDLGTSSKKWRRVYVDTGLSDGTSDLLPTRTTSPTFDVGNGTEGNKDIRANTAATNKPSIRYNDTTKQWELSNNGIDFYHIETGATSSNQYAFRGDGYYRAASAVDINEVGVGGTTTAVVLRREISGTGGVTEIDILKNGVSIFSNPLARPQVASTDGDSFRGVFPVSAAFSVGDRLEMVVLSAETGDPQDLVATLQVT